MAKAFNKTNWDSNIISSGFYGDWPAVNPAARKRAAERLATHVAELSPKGGDNVRDSQPQKRQEAPLFEQG